MAAAAEPVHVPRLVAAPRASPDEIYIVASHNSELDRIGAPVPLKKRASAYASAVLRITYRAPLDSDFAAKRTALEQLFRDNKRLEKEKFHTRKRKTRGAGRPVRTQRAHGQAQAQREQPAALAPSRPRLALPAHGPEGFGRRARSQGSHRVVRVGASNRVRLHSRPSL
jgi:hypothetical protein